MSEDRGATLYYGYEIDLRDSDKENPRNVEDINNDLDITARKVSETGEGALIVIGKEIEVAEKGEAEKITASELLEEITSISKTRKLDEILEKFELKDRDLRLILCSETT